MPFYVRCVRFGGIGAPGPVPRGGATSGRNLGPVGHTAPESGASGGDPGGTEPALPVVLAMRPPLHVAPQM